MTDVHDKKTRSYNMSQIRAKDTKPEIMVRRFLFSHGFRYRLNVKSLPGKPDIVLPKYKTVVFINGCFWHGHDGCKYFVLPKTNTEWWKEKIHKTQQRDQIITDELKSLRWKVYIIWECELKVRRREITLENLLLFLNKNY